MALYLHRHQGIFPGEQWSFGVHTESTLSLGAAQSQWMSALNDFWTDFAPLTCTDVEGTLATTVELDPATGRQLSGLDNGRTDAGTSTATCLPFQCAPVVSLRTALRNRSGRGRFYAPSLAVDQIAAGRMLTTARDALADAGQALLQGLTAAGGDVVIYHRALGTTTPVISLDVGDVIDTQRRRHNQLIEARTSRLV